MHGSLFIALIIFASFAAVFGCTGDGTANSACYTCPHFKKLYTSTFPIFGFEIAPEDVGESCYYSEGSDGFRCQYWSTTPWDDNNKKYHSKNYLGRCVYGANGQRESDSRRGCPPRAPIDQSCIEANKEAEKKLKAEQKAAQEKAQKEYEANKTALALICEGLVKRYITLANLPAKICREPEKAFEALADAQANDPLLSRVTNTGVLKGIEKLRKALIEAGFKPPSNK